MPNFFNSYFWNILPQYLRQSNNDDSNGNPFLKRYLSNFGEELDAKVIPLIDNYIEIFDLITTDEKFLSYISYLLGSLPGLKDDNDLYRLILANAIQIIKNKGNIISYQLYFRLIGIDVDIIEAIPAKAAHYDNGQFYDSDPLIHYDEQCEKCSGYWLTYQGINGMVVTPGLLDKTLNIICFLEPINAQFLGFIPMINLNENIDLNLVNSTNQ